MSEPDPPASDDGDRSLRVMPWWLVLGGFTVAILLGWAVIAWLLKEADQGTTRAQLRIDAIRTGLSVVAGTGGAMALLLAARRQWLSERAQRHQERVDAHARAQQERAQALDEETADVGQRHQDRLARITEFDATERRVTDLFAKAVDHLGNDKAAVRLGGLYGLERLALGNDEHRQTIVDVICAYLRMPDPQTSDDERYVRLTAQRVLFGRLAAGSRIDLAGAVLIDLDVTSCVFAEVDFTRTVFTGRTRFDDATFGGTASFIEATFESEAALARTHWRTDANFDGVTFRAGADFDGATFERRVSCGDGARFLGRTGFRGARFRDSSLFDHAAFAEKASFRDAVFERNVSFDHVTFGEASFTNVSFADMAYFRRTSFHGLASFENVHFDGYVGFERSEFADGITFEPRHMARGPAFGNARFATHALRVWPSGWRETPAAEGWVGVSPAPSAASR
jgi:uncharacterized protein YjbI with pentapeptide repeats